MSEKMNFSHLAFSQVRVGPVLIYFPRVDWHVRKGPLAQHSDFSQALDYIFHDTLENKMQKQAEG